jgi:uncharacterized protein YjiS (DUF1127 family)
MISQQVLETKMITAQAFSTSSSPVTATVLGARLAPLASPLRAMRAYKAWTRIKTLDAHLLADVGLTEPERDAITYGEVFAAA